MFVYPYYILFYYYYYLFFIFGCVGSSLLRAGFSLVEASGGYSFAVVCRLLTVVASLVEEHGL